MKKTAIFLVLMLLFSFYAAARTVSVITMKNGGIYKGKIVDFDNGIYTLEINGKEYKLSENDILKMGWESDSDKKNMKKTPGNDGQDPQPLYVYCRPYAGGLFPGSAAITSVFPGTMINYGVELGFDFGSKFSRYCLGLNFFTRQASGTLTYYDLLEPDNPKTTSQDSAEYIIQLAIGFSFRIIENLPFFCFFDVGAGAGINNDILAQYPTVDDYYTPAGHYERLVMTYPCFAAFTCAGVALEISNNFIIKLGAGYQAFSTNIYNNSDWRGSYPYIYNKEKPSEINGGGFIFTASLEIRI